MGRSLYVVLRHEGVERPHFDLMVQSEPGSLLATWRLERWPAGEAMAVERLGDHRQIYLTFEGEISGGRGVVRRVEQGICDVQRAGETWTIDLTALPGGKKVVLEIGRGMGGEWACAKKG